MQAIDEGVLVQVWIIVMYKRTEQAKHAYGLTPTENGRAPTGIVAITVLVTPLMTETVLSSWFVT